MKRSPMVPSALASNVVMGGRTMRLARVIDRMVRGSNRCLACADRSFMRSLLLIVEFLGPTVRGRG